MADGHVTPHNAAKECCWQTLVSIPRSWRGATRYCACGNLLILRDGEWTVAA